MMNQSVNFVTTSKYTNFNDTERTLSPLEPGKFYDMEELTSLTGITERVTHLRQRKQTETLSKTYL